MFEPVTARGSAELGDNGLLVGEFEQLAAAAPLHGDSDIETPSAALEEATAAAVAAAFAGVEDDDAEDSSGANADDSGNSPVPAEAVGDAAIESATSSHGCGACGNDLAFRKRLPVVNDTATTEIYTGEDPLSLHDALL
eukprot:COSAG05_NODE_5114_length_1260_cov_1.118002_1_plen_138_part_01